MTGLHTGSGRPPRRLVGRVALTMALAATTACGGPVQVLNAPIEASASGPDFAAARLTVGPYDTDAIVLVTANGESTHSQQQPRSDVAVTIASAQPFVIHARDHARDAVTNFPAAGGYASTAYNFRLPAGSTRAIAGFVERLDGANHPSRVTLTVVAVAAR